MLENKLNWKTILTLLGSGLLLFGLHSNISAQEEYYWGNGKRINLKVDSSVVVLDIRDNKDGVDVTALKRHTKIKKANKAMQGEIIAIKLDAKHTENMSILLSEVGIGQAKVSGSRFGYSLEGSPLWPVNRIVLKMRLGYNYEDIAIDLRSQCQYVEEKYGVINLRVGDIRNVTALANQIYESGRVEWCQPDFIAEMKKYVDDPLYDEQYHLNNTTSNLGRLNIDINAPEAWNETTGSATITVAVIDDGVENHEDLNDGYGVTRVLSGYNADPLEPGSGAPGVGHEHGEACAGIIAATHNTIGVRGVTSNVKILPVNIFIGTPSVNETANAIRWAADRADVLSNSWGYPWGFTWHDAIEDAMDDSKPGARDHAQVPKPWRTNPNFRLHKLPYETTEEYLAMQAGENTDETD